MVSKIDARTEMNGSLEPKEERNSSREAVQLMLIGSAPGIDGIVKSLHQLGFAEASDWSKLQHYPNSDKSMSVLTKWRS